MNIKKFEQISHEDEYLINGSELFHWNSKIEKRKKLEIVKWYKNLSEKDRDFVDILRRESENEGWEDGNNSDI
jgi:hypothetical protein